jgi:hypothetical protein
VTLAARFLIRTELEQLVSRYAAADPAAIEALGARDFVSFPPLLVPDDRP